MVLFERALRLRSAGARTRTSSTRRVGRVMACDRTSDRMRSCFVGAQLFCWRSDTPPLICNVRTHMCTRTHTSTHTCTHTHKHTHMQAVPSWFVRVESMRERLLANTAATRWVPAYVQARVHVCACVHVCGRVHVCVRESMSAARARASAAITVHTARMESWQQRGVRASPVMSGAACNHAW